MKNRNNSRNDCDTGCQIHEYQGCIERRPHILNGTKMFPTKSEISCGMGIATVFEKC